MNDETICWCKDVRESAIVRAVREGARTLQAIQETTGACTGNRCKELNPRGRCCSPEIVAIIERETGRRNEPGCCCCGGSSPGPDSDPG